VPQFTSLLARAGSDFSKQKFIVEKVEYEVALP